MRSGWLFSRSFTSLVAEGSRVTWFLLIHEQKQMTPRQARLHCLRRRLGPSFLRSASLCYSQAWSRTLPSAFWARFWRCPRALAGFAMSSLKRRKKYFESPRKYHSSLLLLGAKSNGSRWRQSSPARCCHWKRIQFRQESKVASLEVWPWQYSHASTDCSNKEASGIRSICWQRPPILSSSASERRHSILSIWVAFLLRSSSICSRLCWSDCCTEPCCQCFHAVPFFWEGSSRPFFGR